MRKLLFTFLFIFVASTFIKAQNENELLGPANGIGIVRAISANGRYVVGQQVGTPGTAKGFIWDSESGTNITFLDVPGEAFKVTNDKFVVGVFDDDTYKIDDKALRSGGYWTDTSSWKSLGLGLVSTPVSLNDGSFARAISADGNIIAGYSVSYPIPNDNKIIPYSWTKNGNSWDERAWAYPENIYQGASIIDICDDGIKAVGWVLTTDYGQRQAIYWTSYDSYKYLFESKDRYSEFTCISPNGKYAGFRIEGGCGVFDMETKETFIISEGFIINAISNSGLAIGAYRVPTAIVGSELDKGFVWAKTLGFLDFKEFVSMYTPDLTLTPHLASALNPTHSNTYSLMDITPDGQSIAIKLNAPRTFQAFIYKIGDPVVILPYPKNLTATITIPNRDIVELNWEAPELNGETLTGYTIYRDGEEIITVDENTLTYTEENVPTGYNNYTVKANYGDKQSRHSEITIAVVVDTYALPFYDDFESVSLKTNFWTTEKMLGTKNSPEWGKEMDKAGIGDNGYGADFIINNGSGEFESALISKYFDGTNEANIYLSYIVKPNYYLATETITDTVFVEVYDGTTWNLVDKSIFKLTMEWKAEIFDISEYAAGNFFKIRFRITGTNTTIHSKQIFFDNVTVTSNLPDGSDVPKNIIARKIDNNMQLSWESPNRDFYALTYSNTPKRYSIGNEGVSFIAANYFTTDDLLIYKDKYLTSITAYINQQVLTPSTETQLKLVVFDGNTKIANQDITDFTTNAWNTFKLDEAILLNDKDLKFGIEIVAHDVNEQPVGVDGTREPVTGKGDLFSEDGGITWKTLTNEGLVNNWCIIGNVSEENYDEEWDQDIIGYNIYMDGVRLNEDLIFNQSYTVEYNKYNCYTIRAYSFTNRLSDESEETCLVIHKITASANEGGTITPDSDVFVNDGESQVFSFVADTDFELYEVLVDNQNNAEAVENGSYTFTDVTDDHTINAVFIKKSNVDNEDALQLEIYPNPTKDMLYINIGDEKVQTIKLLDNTGKVLYEENNINRQNTSIDLSNYPSGTYFIKINESITKITKI